MDQELDHIVALVKKSLQQLLPLPQSISAVANSTLFIPPALRDALHDIAHLAEEALQQMEQAVNQIAPRIHSTQTTAHKLEDVVAEYSVQVADIRAENLYLKKLASVRLITYALRNALQHHHQHKKDELYHPTGHVAVVCTSVNDIQDIRHWSNRTANEALGLMCPVLRRLLKQYRGIEYEYDGDGGFIFIFHTPHEALRWCCSAQNTLHNLAWPTALYEQQSCQQVMDPKGQIIFSGLRVQMGLCTGQAHIKQHLNTGEVEYSPALVSKARAITKLSLEGEILVVDDTYEEVTKKNMTKVSLAGIAWLHRKEYIIVENDAQLLRTALPAELMNRRSYYAKDDAEACPLVAVVGDAWSPLDAPHQRDELVKRNITKLQTGVLLDSTKNVDVLAMLKKNGQFLDVLKQLMSAFGLSADFKTEDVIAVLGRATASMRSMQIRMEVLHGLACNQIRNQREEQRRMSEVIATEVKRHLVEMDGRKSIVTFASSDRPSSRTPPKNRLMESSLGTVTSRTSGDESPEHLRRLKKSPSGASLTSPREDDSVVSSASDLQFTVSQRRRSEQMEPSHPIDHLGKQIPSAVCFRDVVPGTKERDALRVQRLPTDEDDWEYNALAGFSFAPDMEDGNGEPEDQNDEDAENIVLERLVSACMENPAQYFLTQASEQPMAVAKTGQQMLRYLSKRSSMPRAIPVSLTDVLHHVSTLQGPAFGSSVQTSTRQRSGSTPLRRTSTATGNDMRLNSAGQRKGSVYQPGVPVTNSDNRPKLDRSSQASLGSQLSQRGRTVDMDISGAKNSENTTHFSRRPPATAKAQRGSQLATDPQSETTDFLGNDPVSGEPSFQPIPRISMSPSSLPNALDDYPFPQDMGPALRRTGSRRSVSPQGRLLGRGVVIPPSKTPPRATR